MTIIPLNQSLRGDERKKIDKTTQNFKCKAKKKKIHQPSQTSDSLGKIFTTCHKELILLMH